MIPPVLEIKDNNMCVGCGACSLICPVHKLEVKYNNHMGMLEIQQVSTTPCSCSTPLCEQVCPSIDSSFTELSHAFGIKGDAWLGPVKHACLSWASDEKLRFKSSSGGTAKALLQFLLETREIDRAVILCVDKKEPLFPKFRSIVDPQEVAEASNSFYLHVPFDTALRTLCEEPDFRTAIVALPCHIQALRKLQSLKTIKGGVLVIGLFCSGINRIQALKQFLLYHKLGQPINNIELRGRGWPGKITVNNKVVYDRKRASPLNSALYRHCFSNDFFLKRCHACADETAELADISLGDAWIPRVVESDNLGTNVALLRSQRGLTIFNKAVDAGILNSSPVTHKEVISSLGSILVGRKLGMWNWPRRKVIPSRNFGIFGRNTTEWPARHVPPMREVIRRRLFWNIACSRIGEYLICPLAVMELGMRIIIQVLKRIIRKMETIGSGEKC